MSKFQAPEQVSGIGLQTGRQFSCEPGGVLTAPDDLTTFELAAILSAGFQPISGENPEARPESSPQIIVPAPVPPAPVEQPPSPGTE